MPSRRSANGGRRMRKAISFAMNRAEWNELHTVMRPPKEKVRREKKPAATKKRWAFPLPSAPGDCLITYYAEAFTKSEARAILKTRLGVDRLPVGIGRFAKVA